MQIDAVHHIGDDRIDIEIGVLQDDEGEDNDEIHITSHFRRRGLKKHRDIDHSTIYGTVTTTYLLHIKTY